MAKLKENETRKTICVSNVDKFNSVNVRNAENEIIGVIKNGAKVVVADFNEAAERNTVTGKDMNTGKKITGTVLTSCLI